MYEHIQNSLNDGGDGKIEEMKERWIERRCRENRGRKGDRFVERQRELKMVRLKWSVLKRKKNIGKYKERK
jgi:hypothetical protein